VQNHNSLQQADQDQNEVKEETTIPIEINEADKINSPSEERLADLTRRLESSDMEGQRLADALEQMSAQKSALERDVAALQSDNDRVRANNEVMASEKWEISAANADLQNRLQTVSYMQVHIIEFMFNQAGHFGGNI
jgi:predicted RNase H-like nuclease (RuvC/YqgF family)